MTEIRTTGVYVIGECNLQLEGCLAVDPAPITVVKLQPSGRQVNVCASCLQVMLDRQEWSAPGAGIRPRYDFAILSKDGGPILVLEVKRKPMGREVDEQNWAAAFARNIAVHGGFPANVYLMLSVLDGMTYVWFVSPRSPYPLLLTAVQTADAFSDLGVQAPTPGLAEEFAESYYREFLRKLVAEGAETRLPWIEKIGLAKSSLTGAKIESQASFAA